MFFFQKCCALLHKIALKISTYYNRGEIYSPFQRKINVSRIKYRFLGQNVFVKAR